MKRCNSQHKPTKVAAPTEQQTTCKEKLASDTPVAAELLQARRPIKEVLHISGGDKAVVVPVDTSLHMLEH